jgi:glycosyltransferase involved in cell wall biosynthesis
MNRQWTINGRFLVQPITGVQRYAREMLLALDALLSCRRDLARDLEIDLVMPPGAASLPALSAIRARTVGNIGGHVWEQCILPAYVRGGLLSFCNTGPLAVTKQLVCIHDLNTRNYPDSYSWAFRGYYRAMLPALGRTATTIATVSNYSASQIKRYRVAPGKQIFVAPNGHEHAMRWTPRHSQATLQAASPNTIVLLGSSAPHKNMDLLLRLSQRLADAGMRIAVVGSTDQRVFTGGAAIRDGGNVQWLGRISDDNLAALLQDSMCLAFPSFEEGFGLPPLEAMTVGCPVVSSDRASMPEICADAALYASPDDPEAWMGCFLRLQGDRDLRRAMKVIGSVQASRFRWSDSAERYLVAMARMDEMEIARSEQGARDLVVSS